MDSDNASDLLAEHNTRGDLWATEVNSGKCNFSPTASITAALNRKAKMPKEKKKQKVKFAISKQQNVAKVLNVWVKKFCFHLQQSSVLHLKTEVNTTLLYFQRFLLCVPNSSQPFGAYITSCMFSLPADTDRVIDLVMSQLSFVEHPLNQVPTLHARRTKWEVRNYGPDSALSISNFYSSTFLAQI